MQGVRWQSDEFVQQLSVMKHKNYLIEAAENELKGSNEAETP
jgi:hypothetical protein